MSKPKHVVRVETIFHGCPVSVPGGSGARGLPGWRLRHERGLEVPGRGRVARRATKRRTSFLEGPAVERYATRSWRTARSASYQTAAGDRRGRDGRRLHGRAGEAGRAQGCPEGHQAGHGHQAGDRALRGGAAGARDDGPPEHRARPRRGCDGDRAALLRDGARPRRSDHRVLRHAQADDGRSDSRSSSRSAARCSTRIRRASSTATSSRRTCS